jgi:hypothetical protein|tara:strand:+ start:2218 stop:2418 length:201 start_codon:yes stop_codon:yes gene_type:complete
MIDVPLYPNGYPCKCSGKCDYSKAYEKAGKPLQIDYESYVRKGFTPATKKEKLIYKYLNTQYCLKK